MNATGSAVPNQDDRLICRRLDKLENVNRSNAIIQSRMFDEITANQSALCDGVGESNARFIFLVEVGRRVKASQDSLKEELSTTKKKMSTLESELRQRMDFLEKRVRELEGKEGSR